MYKNKVNHIKKNELLCLFDNLKDNKIKRIQLSNNNYNNNSSKEKNLKLIELMNWMMIMIIIQIKKILLMI